MATKKISGASEDDDNGGIVWAAIGAAVAIAIGVVLALAIGQARKRNRMPPAVAAASAPAPAASVVALPATVQAAAPDQAHIQVVDGVVRFYFASGKADIAQGAKEALADVVAAAKAGKRLTISGYHDSTGSAEFNAELAKKRAMSVRDALLAEGVPDTGLNLKKPEAMPNTHGNDPQARRVDVTID